MLLRVLAYDRNLKTRSGGKAAPAGVPGAPAIAVQELGFVYPDGHVALDGIETKIGTDVMTFVDHDADGTFMTPFRDFMVKKGDGALSLVAPKLVIGKSVYDFAGDEAKAAFTAKLDRAFASPDYFQNWSDVTNGLAHINRIRADVGFVIDKLPTPSGVFAMIQRIGGVDKRDKLPPPRRPGQRALRPRPSQRQPLHPRPHRPLHPRAAVPGRPCRRTGCRAPSGCPLR